MCIDTFDIPDKSITGSEWESFTFEQWSKRMLLKNKPYKIKPLNYLRLVYRELIQNLGAAKGRKLFFKAILLDLLFKRPLWDPEKFVFSGKDQELFYRSKFMENLPVIVLFRSLAAETGEKRADKLVANTLVPVVLDMMKSKYRPVINIETVEIWLEQARNYLGKEIEKNCGFDGTVYLARDKSELRLHVTRCVNMEILRQYGLQYTATALCMCDHITYHTVFPNLVFKRSHNRAIGDNFCDHELRVKKHMKPAHDEDEYVDCRRSEMFEFVREWEEKAKVLFFGSREQWDNYAAECCHLRKKKISTQQSGE